MAKLKVEIGDKDYLFELDRASIRRGELNGFIPQKIEQQPQTMLSMFWSVGLYKHHPNISYQKAVELYDKYADEGGDIQQVIEFLGEQYQTFSQATPEDSKKVKKAQIID